MKKLLLLLPLLLSPSIYAAHADSLWLLCDDGGLVLNAFEHRKGTEDRETELTLLFGMHRFTGKQSPKVILDGDTGTFEGKIVFTNKNKSVAVNGKLFLGKARNAKEVDGQSFPVNALLKCKTLEGNF